MSGGISEIIHERNIIVIVIVIMSQSM